MFGLAPERSNMLTALASPTSAALYRGVNPLLSVAFTSAPRRMNSNTCVLQPERAAIIRGVSPPDVLVSTPTPNAKAVSRICRSQVALDVHSHRRITYPIACQTKTPSRKIPAIPPAIQIPLLLKASPPYRGDTGRARYICLAASPATRPTSLMASRIWWLMRSCSSGCSSARPQSLSTSLILREQSQST